MVARAQVWVALLRGVNVGRSHRVTMVDLRAAVMAAGGTEVSTHIQSGNVLLSHAGTDRAELTGTLEVTLARELGFPVPVILRSAEELAALVARCPFQGDDWAEGRRRYVTFLASPPAPELLARVSDGGRVQASIYATPTEVCVSPVPSDRPDYPDLDRLLKVATTTRAWNVVEKLATLAARE